MAESEHQYVPVSPNGKRSSLRSIAIASFLTVAINALIPYTHHYMHTISLVEGMMPMGVLMPFLLLIFVVNPVLKQFGKGMELEPWELVIVFSVSYVSIHINEMLGRVLATYAVMHYMATPENLWAEYAYGLVQPWMVVEDAGDRLAWFYEGLPRTETIPWDIWLRPTFWWLSFLGAVGIGCVAFGSIIRRHWVEQERLTFPFATVAEELAETAGPSGFPKYMREPLFWVGFAIPAFIVIWYIGGYFNPGWPSIFVGIENRSIRLGRYVPALHGRINFLIMAFAYFTDLQILLSIWVFWIITWIQIGFTNRIGVVEGVGDFGGAMQQALGGFIVFSVWGLWSARDHLREVFTQAFTQKKTLDDRGELMSYRTAVFLFLGAFVYMLLWMVKGGMGILVAFLVVLFWFVFYIGFAKVIAMTGLVFAESPGLGIKILSIAPPDSLAPGSIAVRQVLGACYQNGKCFAMPGGALAARLAEPLGGRARTLGQTVMATFLLSLVAAAVSTIWLGYQDGAFNFGSYMFRVAAPKYYDGIVTSIRDIGKNTHYGTRMAFTAWGAMVVGVMTFCQYRFTWWPIHPIGYTLVPFHSTRTAILSVFLTWVAKVVILRVGGISLYRRGIPLVIGCVVGYTFALMVSMVVDLIWFPGRGHNLFWGD
jgi:hypothetical protein